MKGIFGLEATLGGVSRGLAKIFGLVSYKCRGPRWNSLGLVEERVAGGFLSSS